MFIQFWNFKLNEIDDTFISHIIVHKNGLFITLQIH